jgi:hypothetical protein
MAVPVKTPLVQDKEKKIRPGNPLQIQPDGFEKLATHQLIHVKKTIKIDKIT